MKDKHIKILGKIIIVFSIVVACISLYIMVNKLGQVDGVICGPGQYYYTDIPNWRDYFLKDYYHSSTPMWFLIVLFFIWGVIMFKFWTWLDRKIK